MSRMSTFEDMMAQRALESRLRGSGDSRVRTEWNEKQRYILAMRRTQMREARLEDEEARAPTFFALLEPSYTCSSRYNVLTATTTSPLPVHSCLFRNLVPGAIRHEIDWFQTTLQEGAIAHTATVGR